MVIDGKVVCLPGIIDDHLAMLWLLGYRCLDNPEEVIIVGDVDQDGLAVRGSSLVMFGFYSVACPCWRGSHYAQRKAAEHAEGHQLVEQTVLCFGHSNPPEKRSLG